MTDPAPAPDVTHRLLNLKAKMKSVESGLIDDISECRDAVANLDYVIKLLFPDAPLVDPKPRNPQRADDVFGPGEVGYLALDILRDARRPLSTRDVYQALLERKEAPRLSMREREALMRKINANLNSKVRLGVLRKLGKRFEKSGSTVWALVTEQ